MTRHPAAVDGTYANRFIHFPSDQLLIGPHVIDRAHHVRTVPELIHIRCCGVARHLTDPDNLVYMLGMEGELFELNVRTLATRLLFDLTEALDTPGEMKCHFKDCYTEADRLVVANNNYSEPDFLGEQSEGTLAEYDGTAWCVLERKPFVGLGGWGGPWWEEDVWANAPSDPFLMTGFDKKVLHLSHESNVDTNFRVEVDFLGCGAWKTCTTITVPAEGYAPHVFPEGFSAHWVRVTALADCTRASAQFHYT